MGEINVGVAGMGSLAYLWSILLLVPFSSQNIATLNPRRTSYSLETAQTGNRMCRTNLKGGTNPAHRFP